MLFSSISPNFEKNLKEELFGCFKYIGIPFDILDKMPVRDRRFYIMRHNRLTQEEQARYEGTKSTNVVDGQFIDKFTDMAQGFNNALNRS